MRNWKDATSPRPQGERRSPELARGISLWKTTNPRMPRGRERSGRGTRFAGGASGGPALRSERGSQKLGGARRAVVSRGRLCESEASWLGVFLMSGSLAVECEPELRVPASRERKVSMSSHREGRLNGK